MKLLVVTNLFHPDQIAGASLYTDMARFFRDQGYEVKVLTTFSYYPAWSLKNEDKGVRTREEVFESISVRRVKMFVPSRPTGMTRMLSDFSFLFSLVFNRSFKKWTPDVILTAEPMLSQCLAQRFMYPFKKIPRIIIVQDFVVDAALELGMLKLPVLSHFLRWMERWALRSAKTLTSISEPMVDKLQGIVGKDKEIMYIPNWIHGSLEREVERQLDSHEGASAVAEALADKKTERDSRRLFYSGNVGMKQGLPQFLEDFEKCRAEGWKIDIHGGGANIAKLKDNVQGKDFITLGNLLDEPEYVEKLLSVTACLITQQPGVSANFLPSKLLPALATGTPVLAVCDEDSPLGIEVKRGKCGVVVAPGNKGELKKVLNDWMTNPSILEKYSSNAREHAKRFSRKTILTRYEDELLKLV